MPVPYPEKLWFDQSEIWCEFWESKKFSRQFYVQSWLGTTVLCCFHNCLLKKNTHLSLSLVLQDLYRLSLDHQTKSAWQTPNMPFLTSPESTCPWGSYSKPIHPFIHSFTHSLVCAVVMSTHCVLGTVLGAQYTVGNISTGSTLPVLTFQHSSLNQY